MERIDMIEAVADGVVKRACAFGSLAIFCVMIGLSYDPVLCSKSGAILASLMAVILAANAWRAPERPYKRTEVWIALDKQTDVPEPMRQRVIGEALKGAYMRHAEFAGVSALVLWVTAFGLMLLR